MELEKELEKEAEEESKRSKVKPFGFLSLARSAEMDKYEFVFNSSNVRTVCLWI